MISAARLVATTRAGWAQNGDRTTTPSSSPTTRGTRDTVTWDTRPDDGTVAPGDPTLTAGGGDIRVSSRALGATSVFRNTCLTDPAGDQTKIFPTNDVDVEKSFTASHADLLSRIATERAGDGELSLELYNPNCPACGPGGPNAGYWARYWSSESSDPSRHPRLEITFGPDNDVWTRAQPIALDGAGNGSDIGSIDVSGQARWYRFAVQPGTRARVDLSNLPGNYDVALFTDIGQAFNTLTSPADLQRLSAEFAADAFSPSVFSPSVFSPSVFSPSVFSPSVFSPSVFSPSVFSPVGVLPVGVLAVGVLARRCSRPSVFSPSVFSPSVFSDGQAYESAQVRSLIAVSANDGNANEQISIDTWNNTGNFYVRVAGRNGAFSPAAPFDLDVARRPEHLHGRDDERRRVAVGSRADRRPDADPRRLRPHEREPDHDAGQAGDPRRCRRRARSSTWGRRAHASPRSTRRPTRNAGCPYAKNLVADAIRDVVLAYRAANPAPRQRGRSSATTRRCRSSAIRTRPGSAPSPATCRRC